jgi:hypothetical protein
MELLEVHYFIANSNCAGATTGSHGVPPADTIAVHETFIVSGTGYWNNQ